MTHPVIVLIDDAPEIGAAFTRLITRAFPTHRLVWARDGVEGIAQVREHAAQLRLVILDVDMPRLDGNLAAVVIRDLVPTVPVLPCTAYRQSLDTFQSLGCVPPLLKRPDMLASLDAHFRQAMATPVTPLVDTSWVAAMRQSAHIILAHVTDTAAAASSTGTPNAQQALAWLDKYCARFGTPAREVLRARKLLRGEPDEFVPAR